MLGNYATVNFAGIVSAGNLRFNESLAAGSIALSNGANVISTLSFIGGETVSGSFGFSTLGALDIQGGTLTAGAVTILSAGNLSIEANTDIDSNGTKTLGSVSGTFINRNGAGPFIGTGRNLIYAATDVGLDQDGLGYMQFNPVAIGSDPAHGLANVVYIAHASLLPTMTVTANNTSRVYGTPDTGFSASVSGGTAGDLVSPVQFEIVGGSDTNAGTYAIQPFGAISSTRALVFDNGTLTVNPALLTVTANDTMRLQGASVPAFSASFSGLVNGDSTSNMFIFFESQGFSTSPAGSYAIQPFGFSQNPNYQLQFVNGTLTIAPGAAAAADQPLRDGHLPHDDGHAEHSHHPAHHHDGHDHDAYIERDQRDAAERHRQPADRHAAADLRPDGRDGPRSIRRVVRSAVR